MLKTAGHVKKHYKPCCILFEEFKNRAGSNATLAQFMQFVEEWANKNIPPDGEERDCFRGDMLEILSEMFFKAFENDPRVGLKDYAIVPLPEDYGVDAKGVNATGRACAVQVKYRGDPRDFVTYAEVARTFTSGVLQQGLPLDGDDSIFVFTTAMDVSIACHTVFGKRVRVINREVISGLIDNNVSFWQLAFDEVKATLLGGGQAVQAPVSQEPQTPGTDVPQGPEVSARKGHRHFGVALKDLVNKGLVKQGDVLVSLNGKYPGLTATVVEDAKISYKGAIYDTPSSAAVVARGGSTDGWRFWGVKDASGNRSLSDLRDVLLGGAV